jgi:hypothetical protein
MLMVIAVTKLPKRTGRPRGFIFAYGLGWKAVASERQ